VGFIGGKNQFTKELHGVFTNQNSLTPCKLCETPW
jgi:hypothetical protein